VAAPVIWRRCTVARACVSGEERRPTRSSSRPTYLGVAYAEAGEVERSQRAFSTLPRPPTAAPPPQRNRHGFGMRPASTCRDSAVRRWRSGTDCPDPSADPQLLAEILSACGGCEPAAPRRSPGARASEAGEGRKTRALNIALAGSTCAGGDYGQANHLSGGGTGQGRKNRIESNDPLMLVNLAARTTAPTVLEGRRSTSR